MTQGKRDLRRQLPLPLLVTPRVRAAADVRGCGHRPLYLVSLICLLLVITRWSCLISLIFQIRKLRLQEVLNCPEVYNSYVQSYRPPRLSSEHLCCPPRWTEQMAAQPVRAVSSMAAPKSWLRVFSLWWQQGIIRHSQTQGEEVSAECLNTGASFHRYLEWVCPGGRMRVGLRSSHSFPKPWSTAVPQVGPSPRWSSRSCGQGTVPGTGSFLQVCCTGLPGLPGLQDLPSECPQGLSPPWVPPRDPGEALAIHGPRLSSRHDSYLHQCNLPMNPMSFSSSQMFLRLTFMSLDPAWHA